MRRPRPRASEMSSAPRRSGLFPFCFLAAAVLILTAGVCHAASRDALLEVVTTCIDPRTPGYCDTCMFPRLESPCALDRDCGKTTEIWGETGEFVVLRDRKMCGCETVFVHGLAVPRTRVEGVEDPRRPDGIWGFAWDVAKKRIPEENDIALAVNPPGKRSQDQLHIHIVRLRGDARKDFDAARSAHIEALDEVWKAAGLKAREVNLKEYGIIVVRNNAGGFMVMVDKNNTEKKYTIWNCGRH